jgi:deoxyribose-phosphate aldolase
MMREELIGTITREVLRALREADGATVSSGPADDAWACDGGARVPREGLVDLCRDLGICRLGGSPGDAPGPGLAGYIDHTILKPDAPREDIERLCREARSAGFASVCVQPWWVGLCADLLGGSSVKVCTVIGFPHGMNKPETKSYESRRAVEDGATELDMVINIGALKSKDYGTVERDIRAVVDCGHPRALVKVILENAYLTDDEKVRGSRITEAAGADYVKTSTGYAPSGATIADIRLMCSSVGPQIKVKSAGGVRTLDALLAVIEAGVSRTGATATATILDDYRIRTSG